MTLWISRTSLVLCGCCSVAQDIQNLDTKPCGKTREEKTVCCQNKGFTCRYINSEMKTYEKEKIGLTPIYVKGVVMNDGVHIHPLNI